MTAALLAALVMAPGEVRIFDGKSLDGWTQVGQGRWEIVNGALRGTCRVADEQGVLVWKDPVADFDLKLQFRISDGNSGVYFRCERVAAQPLLRGFQAEVDAIEDVGGIWDTTGRGWISKPDAALHAKTRFKKGDWNDLEVRARGEQVTVRLNGTVTADVKDTVARKEGWLGLQLHGGMDMTVEFRNIRLTRR